MNSVVTSWLGICIVFSLASWGSSALAVSLYKWVDEDGNVTYQDTPPPDNVNFEEQEFGEDDPERQNNLEITAQLSDAVEQNPITFYAIPNCDACDLVRLFLENNQLPFAEKDIQDNLSVQAELGELTGELRVPTVVVGDSVVDGYSKVALRDALGEKGYPISELESGEVELVDSSGEAFPVGDDESPATTLSDDQLDSIGNAFADQDADSLDEDDQDGGEDSGVVIE